MKRTTLAGFWPAIRLTLLAVGALAGAALITPAQDAPPFRLTPDVAWPTNSVAVPSEVKAFLPVAPTPVNSLAPAVNFSAVDLPTGVHLHPPDTDGAIGPSNVVTMVNGTVRIQDRSGNTNSTTTLSNWWSSVGPFSEIYDPKVAYDPLQARWIAAVVLNGEANPNSAMAVAVSTGSDPTGAWIFQRVASGQIRGYGWIRLDNSQLGPTVGALFRYRPLAHR